MSPRRIEVLGVPVDCVDMQQALISIENMLKGECAQTIIAVNPEKIIKAQNDPFLLQRLKNAGLLIPDGIGVVIAARLLEGVKIKRVPGSELMPEICRLSAEKGYKVFLFGASPDVNLATSTKLKEQFPGISIVGCSHGFLDDKEMPGLITNINDSNAEILFVALGSPRQEIWMDENLKHLNVKVCQGVGGTFDVISGRVKRAPEVFRKIHLEWFYRLITQPKRLFRQTALPKFIGQLIVKKLLH